MARNQELYDAILAGKRKDVARIVQECVDAGADVQSLLNESMIPAMREMGDRFSRNEVFVPEMLIAARAMKAGLEILEPLLAAAGATPRAKVVIGTVKGDLHDIGKNLVAMMLRGAGYEVVDLGVDIEADRFAEAVEKEQAKILMLSALLTTTMQYMAEVAKRLADRPDVRIVIGGAPVTAEYAREIGVHGYGRDANDAVKIVDQLVGAA
ncbi:MAG: corrinoid protein [Candidatus Sumerlaeia bacterium]|nr:corrinoid protein [Candidatus Sumerlaeia bacterium]